MTQITFPEPNGPNQYVWLSVCVSPLPACVSSTSHVLRISSSKKRVPDSVSVLCDQADLSSRLSFRPPATISYPTTSAAEDEDSFLEEGVASWVDEQPGDRILRKANLRMGTADVYKQHRQQEEDMLTTDRLKKGYQMPLTQYELQSLVFNASENKLIRLEKAQKRSQAMIAMVVYRKGEFNMTYDRERKTPKEDIPRFATYQWKRVLSDRVKFFSALSRGSPLQYLAQKIPAFRRKELLFNEFYDYNIDFDRALWCVKMSSILGFTAYNNKQKKTMLEVASLELSQACYKSTLAVLELLIKTRDENDLEELCNMWKYKTEFFKYMFEDGVLDKHEFLNDLCEIFTVIFLEKRIANPSILRLFINYFYYFVEDISSSMLLTRRASSVLCQQIRILYDMGHLIRQVMGNLDENKKLKFTELKDAEGNRVRVPTYEELFSLRNLEHLPHIPDMDPDPNEKSEDQPDGNADNAKAEEETAEVAEKVEESAPAEAEESSGVKRVLIKQEPVDDYDYNAGSNDMTTSVPFRHINIKMEEPSDYETGEHQEHQQSVDQEHRQSVDEYSEMDVDYQSSPSPSPSPSPLSFSGDEIPKWKPPKSRYEEDYAYMKLGEKSPTPELVGSRYGPITYPIWCQQAGVAIDLENEDVLDFSNPTPPEAAPAPQIPMDFDSSPSSSPVPEKDGEDGEKKTEEKKDEKSETSEKEKEKEKNSDEHMHDLDIPMLTTSEDPEAADEKKSEKEDATTKPSESVANPSTTSAVKDVSSDVIMEEAEKSTTPAESSKTEAAPEKSSEEAPAEPMEVDKPAEDKEDDIIIIEPEKKAEEEDPDCVVIAVVEDTRKKEKSAEKDDKSDKEKKDGDEGSKGEDGATVEIVPPAPVEPPREYTEEEKAEMERKRLEELEIARKAEEHKKELMTRLRWEACNIDHGFKVLDECTHYHDIMYLMSGMVQYLTCVTPESFVWNDLMILPEKRSPHVLPQLCGSPLDYLPCSVAELPIPEGADDIIDCLNLRHLEITRRSQAVEEKWLPNGADVLQYGRIIDTCVDVIGIMDNIDVEKPNAIELAGQRLFKFRENFAKEEALLRTKLMFKWCITEEREGSFRATYIAKLLRYGMDLDENGMIGGWNVMDLFFNFMATEGPKYGTKMYQSHFDSTASIMIEMLRENIFSITDILDELEKTEDLDFNSPLMARQRKQKIPKQPKSKKPPVDDRKLVHFHEETTPKRLFMGKKMDLLERMIIILPQLNCEEDTDNYRLRRHLLFGLQPAGNPYFRRARMIYRRIKNEFDGKLYITFDRSTRITTAHKKINQKGLDELLRPFRAQTYHDQHLILERIVYIYIDGLAAFLKKDCHKVPAPEIVNIICEMYEHSQDITAIFDFFEMANPFLKAVDEKIGHFRMDVMPYMYCTETAFIFVSFFMKHWQRFLLHSRACHIVNQCYEMVEDMIRAEDHVITGWGRTVAIFAFHAKKAIINAGLQNEVFLGEDSHFWRVFPNTQHTELDVGHFNEEFGSVKLALRGGTLRYDSFNDFKWVVSTLKPNMKKKPPFRRPNTRYSFVIRAFMEARRHGKNYDRINELANYCASVTANDPPLSEYWIGAIKGLCCLSMDAPYPFKEMSEQIDIADCSTHYPLCSFITNLAGKSAFYVPRLLSELTKHVFPLMLRHDGRLSSQRTREIKRKVSSRAVESRTVSEAEPGVCLCLMIICGLCCVGDEPFGLSVHYKGMERKKKRFNMTADERIMHLFHWFEMDHAMFRTLGHIAQLLEALRSRHRDANLILPKISGMKHPKLRERQDGTMEREKYPPTYYRTQFLFNIAKTVQFVICEQDWVTLRMFRFFKTRKMEAFNQDKLKQNCLGQQILRMALRRRTERENVDKLFEAHAISKKATVDKVLSFMNLWNFRATLFDLMLMIKEISPDGNTRHAQQGAIAADALMCEIGKCCRDMFTFAYKNKTKMPLVKTLTEFRFTDINKYWLIAPLVRMCPKPINIPPQYANTTVGTVAAKFLREAAHLMETPSTAPKERLAQSAWAMSRLPFINMILTCLRCEKSQQSKDVFLQALYQQLQREVLRERHRRTNWTNRQEHRDCTVLRMTLIGYIYKEILKPTHVETWGLLLFQLMYHGILNPVREKIIYDTCYDMLQHMVLWTLVEGDSINNVDRYGSVRVRWPQYYGLMKRIRKETQERYTDPTRDSLFRFLPIAKCQTSTITVRKYMTKPKVVSRLWKKHPCSIGIKHGRYVFLPEDRAKTNAFDHITGYMADGIYRGGWKFHWFHTTRMDKVAKNVQNVLRPNIPHTHMLEFPRPQLAMSDNIFDDIFLSPPEIEITGVSETPVTPGDESDEKTGEEKSEEKKEEETKEGAEKKTNENEKPTDAAGESKDKEGEKDKDAAKKEDLPKELEQSKRESEATPVPITPEIKDVETPPQAEKPAPVARSSPATRGRGGGRKRTSGAGRGGPRAKRANSRADPAQAAAGPAWNVPNAAAASSAAGGNYHAAMRANQPPMSNGSSDETKANIRKLLNSKQEKRNSTNAANAAAAAAAAGGVPQAGMPGIPPTVPNMQLGGAGPTQQLGGMRPPNQMGMTMPGMNPGMQQPPQAAPPPYTAGSDTNRPPVNMFANQPHFAAPNPGPLNRPTTSGPISAESRKQIMEQQMYEKLAQQQQILEQQAKQREARDREAREHMERQQRDARAREEQQRMIREQEEARMRAIEENNRRMEEARILREREEARLREEQARQAAFLEEKARREREEQARREREEQERREREEQARREREEQARREREEQARREREEQQRREEQERIQREFEEKARREKEEAARLQAEQREREEREAREQALKAREAMQREEMNRQRLMEQQRMNQQNPQYMGQQAPPAYGQQPQGQPPSYQQGSYQNPSGYPPGQQPPNQQPPSYQQPSHAMGQQGQQPGQQPPAYQSTNPQMQMAMAQQQQQQSQARQQGQQQPFGAAAAMRQQEFQGYGQQMVGQPGQPTAQQQQQRNIFAGQPDLQGQQGAAPGAKMLIHAKPNEAHAQQYQHTQNQMERVQRQREAQYFQSQQAKLPNAQPNVQQQRFGDATAGNAANFGRTNMQQFGQQQAGAAQQQLQAKNPNTRLLPAPSTTTPMPNQHPSMQAYQQTVLGQPGPMQPGGAGQAAQQQQLGQTGSQQQFPNPRQQMHQTAAKNDPAMRIDPRTAAAVPNRMAQPGYGRPDQPEGYQAQQAQQGFQRGAMEQQAQQAQQQQHAGQYPGGQTQQLGHQAQQQQQQQQAGHPFQQGSYQQGGQAAAGYQRPEQQQFAAQQAQQAQQQQQQQPSFGRNPQEQQYQAQQQAQQAKIGQGAAYAGGFQTQAGQQQGFAQQPGQTANPQMHQQNAQQQQQYGQQQQAQQPQRYGAMSGYSGAGGSSSNILAQSMEESGLNAPGTHGLGAAKPNVPGQPNVMQQQAGYDRQMQMQQQQQQMMSQQAQQQRMAQPGMAQQQQMPPQRAGMTAQAQQAMQQQQQQRAMNPDGRMMSGSQLPPYSMGQQAAGQEQQYRGMGAGAHQQMQQQQQQAAQSQQSRMGMQQQQQPQAGYGNQMQLPSLQHRGQGAQAHGMAQINMQQQQNVPNQYYQQQQQAQADQRMQQQQQQQGLQQQPQHGYGMGQYPGQQQQPPY